MGWAAKSTFTGDHGGGVDSGESTNFSKAGAGPGVGFLNENKTRNWSRSENFSFYRSWMINFIKFNFSLNG